MEHRTRPTSGRTHLPRLFNPFLNALFNNPYANDSSLKSTIKAIADDPENHVLLVPEAKFLWLHFDTEASEGYKDLCHRADFIQSHVVNIKGIPGVANFKRLRTMNGKEIIIQKDLIMPGKGFKHKFSIKIVRKEIVKSFSSYIPYGTCFQVLYIEYAMTGLPQERSIRMISFDKPNEVTDIDENSQAQESDDQDDNRDTALSFAQILREKPLVSEILSAKFKALAHSFDVKKLVDDSLLTEKFEQTIKEADVIFATLSPELLQDLQNSYPKTNFSYLLHSYIEMNIYDKFWVQFVKVREQFTDHPDEPLNRNYENMRGLSLNQVSLPKEYWQDPDLFILLEKRVNLAIEEFKQFEFTNTSTSKCNILMNTFRLLTDEDHGYLVDADTLVSLLIMVVAHARVKNLNKHFEYINFFSHNFEEIESGYRGYIFSTFEAVLNYFNESDNLNQIFKLSAENTRFWNLISSVSKDSDENYDVNSINSSPKSGTQKDFNRDNLIVSKINIILQPYETGDNIARDSFIRSRTLQGESCLMLALRQGNQNLFATIANYDKIFTLDDILEDKDISGSNLLSEALQLKSCEIIEDLTDIILQANPEEIKKFCESTDIYGKNVGHYLFNHYHIIEQLSPYIDWTKQDNNKQTPFFSMVRCYDHPEYDELFDITLKAVKSWYKAKTRKFNVLDHIDSKGNTLIHSIKTGKSLALFLKTFDDINLNAINSTKLTPLMQFIKYNKIDNIRVILKDRRLDLFRSDSSYYLNAMDYVKIDKIQKESNSATGTESTESEDPNVLIMNMVDSEVIERYMPVVENKSFGVTRLRYNAAHELCLYVRTLFISSNGEKTWTNTTHTIEDFKKMVKLLKIEFPNSFFNCDEENWFPKVLDIQGKANIDYLNKVKLNKQLLIFNVFMTGIMFNNSLVNHELIWEFNIIPQPLNEMRDLKRINLKLESIKSDFCDESEHQFISLKPEDVGNMKTFVQYSVNDFTSLNKSLDRFYRYICFNQLKDQDLLYILMNQSKLIAGTINPDNITKHLDQLPIEPILLIEEAYVQLAKDSDATNTVQARDRFAEQIKLLKNSTNEIIKAIDSFVTLKIGKWWEFYGEMILIYDELERLKAIELSKQKDSQTLKLIDDALIDISRVTGNASNLTPSDLEKLNEAKSYVNSIGENNGGAEDTSNDDITLSSISSDGSGAGLDKNFLINDLTSGSDEIAQVSARELVPSKIRVDRALGGASSYFTGVVESRRFLYTQKLVNRMLVLRANIIKLNLEIKINYENLAVEISNFISFKKNFTKFIFRQYTTLQLRELRTGLGILTRGLDRYKHRHIDVNKVRLSTYNKDQ